MKKEDSPDGNTGKILVLGDYKRGDRGPAKVIRKKMVKTLDPTSDPRIRLKRQAFTQ